MKLKEIIYLMLPSIGIGLVLSFAGTVTFFYFSELFGVPDNSTIWYGNIKCIAIITFLYGFLIDFGVVFEINFIDKNNVKGD